MENLNAEKVIDILDKMDFFEGQRAGRELWNDKPFEVQEQDITNFSRDISLIKEYIKSQEQRIGELTDEKDTWEAIAKSYQKQFEDCYEEKAKLTEENERLRASSVDYRNIPDIIAEAKAETVRKMQERIKEYFPYDADSGLYVVLDQIAKEMLEGEK